MKAIKQFISLTLILALTSLGAFAQTRTRPYGQSDRQKRQVMDTIQLNADRFRASIDDAFANNNSGSNNSRLDVEIYNPLRDFNVAITNLRQRFEQRRDTASDMQRVFDAAARIDDFVLRNRLTQRTQTDWASVRNNVNQLANIYNLPSPFNGNNNNGGFGNNGGNGNNGGYGNTGGYGNNNVTRLNGTYSLDASRSDNPQTAADNATRNLSDVERQRVNEQLINRLSAPDQIAIQRSGRNVTVASSRAPQITFDADGTERTETLNNGRTIRVSATLYGDQLTVNTIGNDNNDFSVTFDPLENGRRLRVTRRITVRELTQPIVVRSVYNKTDDVARFDIYNGTNNRYPTTGGGYGNGNGRYPNNPNGFVIPNGTTVVATLDSLVSTNVSRNGDRFIMTVQQPSQFAGARLEGTLSDINNSGRVSGRAGLTFNFDTIRLRNGQTYSFAGFVDSIRTPNGDTVQVDNEGAVKDKDNQTTKTVERGAIGAGIGAIIGAIAGGGKGAAIGAVLGGGAGAGSVFVQGRDTLELQQGTEVTLHSSSPNNVPYNR